MPRRRTAGRRARPRIAQEIRRNAGKYVALARDWSKVVAVGKTWREALEEARVAGFNDAPVPLAARDYSGVAF